MPGRKAEGRRVGTALLATDDLFSFLIIGVLLAAYEVFLQRIKPAPPDEAPPAAGPGNQAGLTSGIGGT
jgi:hypothetical protein